MTTGDHHNQRRVSGRGDHLDGDPDVAAGSGGLVDVMACAWDVYRSARPTAASPPPAPLGGGRVFGPRLGREMPLQFGSRNDAIRKRSIAMVATLSILAIWGCRRRRLVGKSAGHTAHSAHFALITGGPTDINTTSEVGP